MNRNYYIIHSGTLEEVFDPSEHNNKFYRTFYIKTLADHSNDIRLQLIDENCNLIDDHKIGDIIKVKFHIVGQRRGDKLYNNNIAVSITPDE